MTRLPIILLAMLALGGTAFAAESGASSKSPGHEMQDKGSKPGSPGASGYAPGHEKSDSTGSTSGTSGSGTASGSSSGSMKSGSGSSR